MNYQKQIVDKYMYIRSIDKKEMVNITEETKFFKLRNTKKERTREIDVFLKTIKEKNNEENVLNEKGSGIYNFKTGDSVIQLDIFVTSKEVSIKPYILYNQEEIQTDFLKLLKLDEVLHEIIENF